MLSCKALEWVAPHGVFFSLFSFISFSLLLSLPAGLEELEPDTRHFPLPVDAIKGLGFDAPRRRRRTSRSPLPSSSPFYCRTSHSRAPRARLRAFSLSLSLSVKLSRVFFFFFFKLEINFCFCFCFWKCCETTALPRKVSQCDILNLNRERKGKVCFRRGNFKKVLFQIDLKAN